MQLFLNDGDVQAKQIAPLDGAPRKVSHCDAGQRPSSGEGRHDAIRRYSTLFDASSGILGPHEFTRNIC